MLLRALIVGAEGGPRRSAARAAGLADALVSEVATTEEMRRTLSAKPWSNRSARTMAPTRAQRFFATHWPLTMRTVSP